jgi:hypothetical protein
MDDNKYQMDELQMGILMVKHIMGRSFVKSKWLSGRVILEVWLGNPSLFEE